MKTPSDKVRLALLGLPSIDSLEDLSRLTHLSKWLLYRLSKFSEKRYILYNLPKKGSGFRTIAQPSRTLKAVQIWILRNILDRLAVSPACKGFEKGTSIVHNASPHAGANAVICLDLENFFPTIQVNQVWSIFRTIGYSPRISAILAKLCTFRGNLPQGSPASPKLANLVAMRMDNRLLGYVGKRSISYTRYADDLTFSASSPGRLVEARPTIRKIIESEGFQINDAKTRIAGAGRQHRITGLIVTDSGVGIGRKLLRKLRSKINHLCKSTKKKASASDVNHINGWLAFVKSVDRERSMVLNRYIGLLKKKYPRSGVKLLQPT